MEKEKLANLFKSKQLNQNILNVETRNLKNLVGQLLSQHDAIDRGFGGEDLNAVIKETNKAIALCNYRLTNAFEMLETVNLGIKEYYMTNPITTIDEIEALK